MGRAPEPKKRVLLVEDNPFDVKLTKNALADCKMQMHLQVARDGEEALAILHRQEPHGAAERPDLVLLDLNLPKMDGLEVLTQIKRDPSLRQIPVVVLTTSRAGPDMLGAYDLHVNCFVTKPMDVKQFMDVIKAIDHFWFSIATLPQDDCEPAAR